MKIEFKQNPTVEEINVITKFLNIHAKQNNINENYHKITLLLKNENEKICGGLFGVTIFNMLKIKDLAIDEKYRGENYGTQLVQRAEKLAREYGCIHSHLNTMEYQAAEFYKKRDYKVMFIRKDENPNLNIYYFYKKLV